MEQVRKFTNMKNIAGWVISGLGLALAGLSIWYVLFVRGFTSSMAFGVWGILIEGIQVILLAIFSVVLVYGGYWLASSPFQSNRVWWAGLWTIIGLTGILTIVTLVTSYQLIRGDSFPEHILLQTMLLAGGGGALAGLLIGVSTIREGSEADKAQKRLESMELVNELLRHNVLNGMQIVQAYSRELEDHVDETGEDHLETIQQRTSTIAELVENVGVLMESISDEYELSSVNLSQVLKDAVSTARGSYPSAHFTTDIPTNVQVLADELLDAVIENILSNAVEHNDSPEPHVDITVVEQSNSVILQIADNGPGIPESKREQYLQAGEQGEESFGQGLGLYLVDTLVDRYHGEVWIEANDPRGTVVSIELNQPGAS